jgi:hypothetical protein
MKKRYALFFQHPQSGYEFVGISYFFDGMPFILDTSTLKLHHPSWCICLGDV